MMMQRGTAYRFGISEFTTWPWTFAKDVEHYATHGVDAIEVCEFKLAPLDYGAQLRSLAQRKLSVSSVQSTVHSLFPDSLEKSPRDPRDRVACIMRSIDRIAPHLPAQTPFVVITGAAPDGNCESVYRFALSAFERLADHAHSYGMRIAFEPLNPILFHTDTALWGLDNGLELVRRVDHPALGLCVDMWNIFETPNVEQVIRACGDRIFVVQVSDWRRPRNNADRVCIGDGCIPMSSLLRAVAQTGYRRAYVLEIFSSQTLPDSLWNPELLDQVIDRNIVNFEQAWDRAEASV